VFDSAKLMYATGAGSFYDTEISQSLRFNDDDSAYLSRTPASAGNRKTWTWSGWVKRGNLGSRQTIFSVYGGTNSNDFIELRFDSSTDALTLGLYSADGFVTNQVFRDTSSWYHIVVVMDTTQATDTNRLKLYVNGAQVTSFSSTSYPSQNSNTAMGMAAIHSIGSLIFNNNYYNDGYLAEVNFIDGTALDATSFGEFKSGVWIPKAYSGSYGTNGFYLPFNHDYSVEGFSATTYRGNGTSQYIGGVGFEPDLVWIKNRDATESHTLFDSIRGVGERLFSNLNIAENTASNSLTSFDTDGFSVGSHSGVNASGQGNVAWCWDAGTGSPVSNTDGSITSTVKASTDYGFSIVDFTTTSGVETTGHGLSSAPEMIITKKRDGTNNWFTYHTSIGATKFLYLNEVNGAGTSTVWNDTAPTSSVFTTNAAVFGAGNFIAYCFHSVSGYSKFGSYSGTGASGNSVTTGFKPAMVVVKRTDSADSWYVYDNVRGGDTDNDSALRWNGSDAESDFNATDGLSFTSTGFTVEATDSAINSSSGTYIYMAFADKREAAFWLDQSGNNNDFENNNLTESDISLDSPTNNGLLKLFVIARVMYLLESVKMMKYLAQILMALVKLGCILMLEQFIRKEPQITHQLHLQLAI